MAMEVEEYDEDINTKESALKRSLLAKNKLALIIKGPDGSAHYCCVQCPLQFLDKESLESHLFSHSNEYRYLCGICGTGLKRKEHLDRHTLEHQQVRPHVCEICHKAFKRKEHLTIHKSIHSGDKNEICMLCQKSFYRKDHLQKHLQTHSKTFMMQNTLQDHNVIGANAEVMDLEVPEVYDDSSQDLNGVEDIEVTPDQNLIIDETSKKELRPYACDLCDKTYKRRDHLKLHSRTHLKKDKICSECGKAFQKDEELLQHMNVHLQAYSIMNGDEDKSQLQALLTEHNIDPSILQSDNSLLVPRVIISTVDASTRRHECDICHRRFKRRQHLLVHQSRHAKTQPNIWCANCREGFYSNQGFERHECMNGFKGNGAEEFLDIKIENPPPSEQMLDIKIINAKKENEYPPEAILPLEPQEDETQYLISDESALPTPQRVYVCKFCNKPFKRKDHYKIHLHIHTGVKSFFCTDCGKGFYRKDHLQKHSLVHNKPKPKPKKALPDLMPISALTKKNDKHTVFNDKKEIKPEITIHAPLNTKLRVPLQIKVPYQMVMSMDNGEQRAVTIDPQASAREHIS